MRSRIVSGNGHVIGQNKVGIQLELDSVKNKYQKEFKQLANYRRVTNYLSAAQLYLKENFLLREELQKEHFKERLLGHWGTCPGLNLVYSHCNLLIKQQDVDMFLVVGPGHGAPAILSNLHIEGALEKYYPNYSNNYEGLDNLIRGFSWPGGFPSHVNAEFPGSIHEGGELGYALAVSFGAVMDNPDLIVTCVVGDGESETGPTATAWHSYKFLDPKESGAVIPIIHLNGYKISSRTIFGTMSDQDLYEMFSGYGYQVRFVENMDDIDADMYASMEWAYQEIRSIQKAARGGNPIFKPKWPLLIMKTPKGWTGIKELHGQQIEGSFRSHGIPAMDPQHDDEVFKKVGDWLRSYNVSEFFDKNGKLRDEIRSICPPPEKQMSRNKHTLPKLKPLDLPPIDDFEQFLPEDEKRGSKFCSITEITGKFLTAVIQKNPNTFRIFSPDELVSNKLNDVLSVTTRNNQWDEEVANKGGRVIEVLSEHTCQGFMQGYTLTGRYALFPSYETFLGIITTMMIQYAKFIKIGMETSWKTPVPSLNYIETSTLWRQEHNGYSHQNPMFLNNLINMKEKIARVYLPPDANACLYVTRHCLKSTNQINLIISSKNALPLLLNKEEAFRLAQSGIAVWKWMSTDEGENPDVIIVGCGNETNIEAMAAAKLLQRDIPQIRIRFVNVCDLTVLDTDRQTTGLTTEEFEAIFTKDKPVIFNFHGYPSAVHQILFSRPNPGRFFVNGYIEEGTTTTPFRMLTANKVSRFDVAITAILNTIPHNQEAGLVGHTMIAKYRKALREHSEYIVKYGKDPEYIKDFLLQKQ